MKNIGIITSDKVLSQILNFVFQKYYKLLEIDFDRDSNLKFINKIDLLIIDSCIIDHKRIKKIHLLKKIHLSLPIIFLYDFNISHDFENEILNFADVMFRKPFNNRQLLCAVNSFWETGTQSLAS